MHLGLAPEGGGRRLPRPGERCPHNGPHQDGGCHQERATRRGRLSRRLGARENARIRRLDRFLLRRLIHAGQQRLQQHAGSVGILLHGLKRHLGIGLPRAFPLQREEIAPQCGQPRRGRLGIRHHPGPGCRRFRTERGAQGIELLAKRPDLGVVRPELGERGVEIGLGLRLLQPHGDDILRHAAAVARNILPRPGGREIVLRAHQVVAERAQLLCAHAGLHAGDKTVLLPIAGDGGLLRHQLGAQAGGAVLHPQGRGPKGGGFEAELIREIEVDNLVRHRRGEHRIPRGEGDGEDAAAIDRAHSDRVQDRGIEHQRPLGRRQIRAAGEAWLIAEIEVHGDPMGDGQAGQDRALAGHHRIRGRIALEDALQDLGRVARRVVDHRSGCGIEHRHPGNR
jgi:hypothetical protein